MTVLCNASLIDVRNSVDLNEKHKTLNLGRGRETTLFYAAAEKQQRPSA
jgi:hypothetical protein